MTRPGFLPRQPENQEVELLVLALLGLTGNAEVFRRGEVCVTVCVRRWLLAVSANNHDFEQANAPESIKNGLIYNVCDKRGPLKNYQRTSQFSSDPLSVLPSLSLLFWFFDLRPCCFSALSPLSYVLLPALRNTLYATCPSTTCYSSNSAAKGMAV